MTSSFRPLLSLLLATLCLPAAGTPAAAAEEGLQEALARLPTLPVEEVHRGQTGYGLTVFAGTTPERFEVEVIGVLRNPDPGSTYVLARLTGNGLEDSGVVSGMSGSPVFVDDRLVGAVAFAWPFAKEAIAGITPIDAMRAIAELPSGMPPDPVPVSAGSASGGPGALPALSLEDLVSGELPEDLLDRALEALQPVSGQGVTGGSPAIGWATAGFGPQARSTLSRSLGVAAGAGGRTEEAGPLVPGAPVGAVLVDGDLQLAATGTVTERSGEEVLAFGHSFLGLGPLSVPMASAEILTVLPSNYNSFKISNLGPVVGAFEQDSQAGIRGRLGAEAPMIPFDLRVRGLREQDFRMRIAAVPQLVPALVAAATVGGLDSATFSNGPQGLDLEASFDLGEWGELPVRQSFDGPNAAAAAATHLVAFAAYLVQNPLEAVAIEGIEATLTQTARPRTATLVAAHAERTVVRPGESVRLNLDFKRHRGEMFRKSLEVGVPEDLPAGRLSMLVGDGESADATRLAMLPAQPVTFPQALELLRSFHSKRDLMVLQVFQGTGVSVAGDTLPRLPGSIQSVWKAAASGSARPLRLAVQSVEAESLPFPASGIVRIDLEVRRRAPLVAEQASGAGEPADGPAPEEPPPPDDGAGSEGSDPDSGSASESGGDAGSGPDSQEDTVRSLEGGR